MFGALLDELTDEEAGFLKYAVTVPLFFCGLLTIPYLKNPLMNFPFNVIIIGLSLSFTLYFFGTGLALTSHIILSAAASVVFFALEMRSI